MIAFALLLLAQNAADPALVARGEKIFAQSCSVGYCHGVAGAAGRGPRLRGRTFSKEYLLNVTRDGIPSSAMPAWKGRLKDDEIRAVVEYVASLSSATDPATPANPMPPGIGPAAIPGFNGPPEAARGHALFFDLARNNCSVCHAVGGRGIAIGPDLTTMRANVIGRPDLTTLPVKNAAELTSQIHATRSRHVLTAKLASGEEFPALLAEQDANQVRLYDLTVTPPVRRTFARRDIVSLTQNAAWRHEDFVHDYSAAELEDVVVYLRWAATGR
jgi:mono/diheme cytochrome c family protein